MANSILGHSLFLELAMEVQVNMFNYLKIAFAVLGCSRPLPTSD